tara:strand:- start:692 stop:1261 length:570 start_codon:yes stop_codon:yes gene_type:complete
MIKTDLIERTDADKNFTNIFDISIGSFINHNLMIGMTNEDAVADYIKEGYNPIRDSLVISSFQLFLRYYNTERLYFVFKVPGPSFNARNNDWSDIGFPVDFPVLSQARVGIGYVFDLKNNFDLDISYDMLLSENINNWNKGKLSIGVSTEALINLPVSSFSNNILQKFVSWVNTPLPSGYREHMLGQVN